MPVLVKHFFLLLKHAEALAKYKGTGFNYFQSSLSQMAVGDRDL